MEPEPHSPSNSRRTRLNVPPLVDSWTGYRSKMETPTPTTGDFRSNSSFSQINVPVQDTRQPGAFSDVELDMAKFLTGLKGLHSGRSSAAATPYAVSRNGTPPTPSFTSSGRHANVTSAINQSLSELSVDRQPASSLRRRVDSYERLHGTELSQQPYLPRVPSTDAIRNRHGRTVSSESHPNTSPSQTLTSNVNKRRRINARSTQTTATPSTTTRPRARSNLSQSSDVNEQSHVGLSAPRLPDIAEQHALMRPPHEGTMGASSEQNFLVAARSKHSLAYCVSWLGWAQGHLHKIDTTLDGILAEYERDDMHQQLPSGAFMSANFIRSSKTPSLSNSMTSTPSVITMSDTTVQRIQILRTECLSTMHKAMDIVSKSAGGSLPENARETVKKMLVELPSRFDLASGRSTRSRVMYSAGPQHPPHQSIETQERDMLDPDITPPATRQAETDGDVEMSDETWQEPRIRPPQTATETALDVAYGVSILTKEGMEMLTKVTAILGQAMASAEQQQDQHITPKKTRTMLKASSPGRQMHGEVGGPASALLTNPVMLQSPIAATTPLAMPVPILPAPLPIVQTPAFTPAISAPTRNEAQSSLPTQTPTQQHQNDPRRPSTSSFQIPGETLASNAPLVKTATQKEETPAVLLPSASMSSTSHKLQTFDPFTKEIIDHGDQDRAAVEARTEKEMETEEQVRDTAEQETARQPTERELAARAEEERNAQLAMHIHHQQQVASTHAQIHHHQQATAAHIRRLEMQAHVNSTLEHQQQELDTPMNVNKSNMNMAIDNRLAPGSNTPPSLFTQTMPIRLLPPLMMQGSVSNEVLPSIEVPAPRNQPQPQNMQYPSSQFEFSRQGPRLAAEDMLMHGHLYGSVHEDAEQHQRARDRERKFVDTNIHASHSHAQRGNVLPPISFLERIADLHEVEHGENYAMRYIDEMSGYPRAGPSGPPQMQSAPTMQSASAISASRLTAEDMLMHGVRRDERPAHPYGGQGQGYGFGHGHGFGPRL